MFKILLLNQGDAVIKAVDKSLMFDAVMQWIIIGISILMMIAAVLIIKRIMKGK